MPSKPYRDEVVHPRVTTDKSVDCHSLESIVAGVCTEEMSDQEKAIALFHFVRRMMFHYPQRSERLSPEDDLDTLRLVNTYGYSFCSQQALVLVDLWRSSGLGGMAWSVPGHCTAQVEYDGGMHWFDPLIGAYVLRRDGGSVASLADIAEDPTLLTKAAEEGRACAGFVPCGTVLRRDAEVFCKHDPQYVQECRDLIDDVAFMAAVAGQAEPALEPNPPVYDPDVALRRGESVLFLWDHLDGEYNVRHLEEGEPPRKDTVAPDMLPPHHFCGVEAEQLDAANYRYWQSYARTVCGVRTCRYQANGRHTYAPDLSREPGMADFGENSFQWTGRQDGAPALRPARAGQPASLVWRMRTPHVYTSATLTVDFVRAADDDVSRTLISSDGGKTWSKVYDAAEANVGAGTVEARVRITEAIRGMRDVWMKIESSTTGEPARAGVDGLAVECIFQHNMFARPFLAPGANRVTVTTARPEGLSHLPLTVRWQWQESGRARSHTQAVAAVPSDYTIEVGGEAMPRMLSLEISVRTQQRSHR